MTLNDFTQAIADISGQRDATSFAAYTRFVNFRYRMIWDRLDWNDARTVFETNSVAGTPTIDLPATLNRVIRIRYDDHFLDPVTLGFFIETDPGMFERTGIPQYYEEKTVQTTVQVWFYPIPAVERPVLIEGKKAFTPLVSDTDATVIRNIDNCLLAYVIGDALDRQRQTGKAGEKYKEASLLFDELIKLEKEQSNVPRTNKALTVAGNSLAEMTDDVCARCGDYQPATRIVIKQFLRRQYQMLYDLAFWNESLVLVNVAHDGMQAIMPEYVGRVISVRENANTYYSLSPADNSLYFGMAPQIFEQSGGQPINFSYLTPVGVAVLPPQREKLAIASTSSADKGNVFIKGESAGVMVSETLVLNGTTSVVTQNDYDVPLTLSKLVSTGDVIVVGFTSGAQLERILAAETERKHIRLWLQPNGVPGTMLVLAKRRIRPLLQDEDTPLLSDIQNVLIYAATSECFTKLKDAPSAADAKGKADAALKTLLDLNTQQGAASPRVIPYAEAYADYSNNCEGWFLPKG